MNTLKIRQIELTEKEKQYILRKALEAKQLGYATEITTWHDHELKIIEISYKEQFKN